MTTGPHDRRSDGAAPHSGVDAERHAAEHENREVAAAKQRELAARRAKLGQRGHALRDDITRIEMRRRELRHIHDRLLSQLDDVHQQLDAVSKEVAHLDGLVHARLMEVTAVEYERRELVADREERNSESVAPTDAKSSSEAEGRSGVPVVTPAPVQAAGIPAVRAVLEAVATLPEAEVYEPSEPIRRRLRIADPLPLIAVITTVLSLSVVATWLTLKAPVPPRGGAGVDVPAPVPPVPGSKFDPTAAPKPSRLTDRFDEVDAALRELVVGRIAFNIPERMQFRETRAVAVIGSPGLDANALGAELRQRIGGKDPIAFAGLQMAALMEARLDGASAFAVAPLTATRQPVSRNAPTEWRWNVRAEEAGRHALNLTMDAIITFEGERFPRSVNVLKREIDVEISPAQRLGLFVEGNWQWLAGTVLIPLGVWLWNRKRPNRQARKRKRK